MSASILPILLLFDIAIHWAQPPLNLFVRTYMQISLEINLFSGRNVRFAVAKLNKSSLGRLGKAQKKQKKKTQLNIRFPFAPYTLGTWGIYHCELHSFIQLTGNKNDIVHALAWKWAHIHERSKRKKIIDFLLFYAGNNLTRCHFELELHPRSSTKHDRTLTHSHKLGRYK